MSNLHSSKRLVDARVPLVHAEARGSGTRPRSLASESTSPGRGPHRRDARLLKALQEIPRRLFFPDGVDPETSNYVPVELEHGRILPAADVVALMLSALELTGTERVLDVGGSSGYQAALLSRLAREVYSIALDPRLVEGTQRTLIALGCNNVRVIGCDPRAGWPDAAPYQGIVVGTGASEVPPTLIEQLDIGGRLVIPLGDADAQLVERLRKGENTINFETLGACHLGMLPSSSRIRALFPWTPVHEA
jgi:protein-L-isoaspartate(D-aspartate) O-methyltransferase